MSKEPELSIKVSVDPVIDGEHLGIDIQNQIDKLNNLPKVKIDPDTKNFGKDLSKQISQNLRAVNRVLKTQLDRMSTNINSLNQVSQELFSGTDFSSNIQSQAEIVSSSLKNIEDHISTLSSMFEASNSTKLKLSGSFSSIEELDNLIVLVKNNLSSLFNDGPLNDDNEFSKTFTAALPSIKKLRDIIFDIEEISDNKTVLKKLGIDEKSLVNSRNNLELLSSLLDTIIDYNDIGDIGGIFDELKSTENISKYFSVALSSLKELDTTLDNTSKKTTNIKKNTKIFDRSQLDEISNAYSEAIGNLISKQNAFNRSKEITINLEDQLLQKTTETTAKIGEQVQNLKTLFSEVASSDIGKQLPAVSEYMKSKAELEASKNIESAKSLSLNVNSSSAKEYEAALKGIKDHVSELSKENAFSNLNSNIAKNARVFNEAKAPVKDYVAALNDANRKSREARLPQQRTTGLNVSNIENYSQKVTAIKNDLYALKDTVFPTVYSDINRTYGHLFDDSITNVQSYIDKLNEIPAAASSKAPANRAPAKTQHNKNAETIDSTNIKNYATLLNGIQGAMNDMKTTIVPGFDEVLDKNGKKINDIGTSLVNYVAVLKRGLKAVDQSEKAMADKTAAKPVAVPTKNNAPVKKPTAQKTQDAKATINSNEIVVIGDPIDIPGKVTLKVEDVTPPKGSVKIPGKVELKVSDITPPKTAVKLKGIPETPNYTKPSETLDDYRDSVGAAAVIQEYFAKEVDNATAALGSQSETLKALKKSLDEYTGSIDGIEKFAKAEKELDQLKKKLAQQQQQQPAQPAPKQPNNQPLAPITPNSNPKPNNNGQPPAPPTPPNNRSQNNGGNNGGNNSPVESQRKLEQALERIMTKMITAQNKKDTSGDKGYGKNAAEQVKWQGQLHDRAEELIDKLNANYPGWEKGKSWKRHGENIAHARNDYSTAREDKQDLDYVKDITSQYSQLESLYKRRVSLFKPDQVDNLRDIDDEIKSINSDLAKTYAETKQNGYDLTGNSDIQESIDSLSREKKISKRDFAKNQQQYNNAQIEDLFDEYERLTRKLQTYGQRRASSIGSDNVQAQSNVLRDYINTQTELNKLESEFKNRGFLKAGSAEWQQTYDLMGKRKDLEKAVEFEVNNRIQAEQEAIRVQDKDRLSLLAYIKTIEKYKDTLEKDNKTDSAVYGKSVGMSNAGWDLLNELNKNPDNKDQVANLWGQKYNLQGVTDLESAFKALAVEAAKAGIEVQDLRTETEKFRADTQAKTNVANIKSQLMDYLEKFPKVEKYLAEPVQKLKAALADPNAYKDAGRLKQAMAELRAQAKSLGLESENLIDKFQKLFGQHLSTMITMAALHKMQDALRIVYQNVVEIDTAVTELRKVSEYAGKSLEEYMGRAAEQAQKLGVSISDYINSTADWKRLGYSDEDAENLATYSTLLKNVGDNIDDVNTSSSYLISTLQGFGLLADQAEDVVNKIDAVANTQPVTAKDLGEILTRSSAAMSAANNTLEETIALGTAANAVIQDADTVGTTLKSLSMYLRAAKSDAENAGIEVDGMANSVSELRSELKSLTGVDIMLDSKNFKSTYQIMKELSQVWSGLSDVTQANVTEMIGGKRNANAVSAILNNFDVAESAMESAANSANVAWEENEKWLDSIQGRLGQLDASFQVLSQDVLSSGLVKTGVSFLTSIVKLLDKFINLTGALPAGLGIAAFATQLGEPKMTGFMIVPSNTPGGDTEQVLRRYFIISLRSAREYLVKPTNMVAWPRRVWVILVREPKGIRRQAIADAKISDRSFREHNVGTELYA